MGHSYNLKEKIEKARKIIKEADDKYPNIAVAWTGGKDSTVVLHLVKEVFGKVPYLVMFNDSTIEFSEIYDFIKRIKKEWGLDLLWLKHLPADLEAYKKAKTKDEQMQIMREAKINAINYAIREYNLDAFISGIRLDEQAARGKETYFSERNNHTRVHPILDFTLDDIWEYIHSKEVPYVNLYDKGYKSLGEKPFTKPSTGDERSGREATKEQIMADLRKAGYW